VEYIGRELLGEPYGWGGKLKTRDCSTFTRDFFSTFGIYLPRNSRQQAKSWKFYTSKRLSRADKKERNQIFKEGYLGKKTLWFRLPL